MGTAQVAEQIGLHHLLVGLQRRFVERAHGADAGIVDPDVDPALAECCRGARQRLDLVAVGHVGGHCQHVGAQRPALIRRFRQGLLITCGEHQPSALAGERLGRGAADTAGGTGQYHQGAVEISVGHARAPQSAVVP